MFPGCVAAAFSNLNPKTTLSNFTRMKKKVHHRQPRKPCIITYDRTRHGWLVQGTYKPVFTERQDLENYCRNKLGRLPILDPSIKERPGRTYYWTDEDEETAGDRPYLISGGAFEMNRRKH
jgi:hypothetical protein